MRCVLVVNDDNINPTICKNHVYDKQEMQQLLEYSYADPTPHPTGSIAVAVLLLQGPTVAAATGNTQSWRTAVYWDKGV